MCKSHVVLHGGPEYIHGSVRQSALLRAVALRFLPNSRCDEVDEIDIFQDSRNSSGYHQANIYWTLTIGTLNSVPVYPCRYFPTAECKSCEIGLTTLKWLFWTAGFTLPTNVSYLSHPGEETGHVLAPSCLSVVNGGTVTLILTKAGFVGSTKEGGFASVTTTAARILFIDTFICNDAQIHMRMPSIRALFWTFFSFLHKKLKLSFIFSSQLQSVQADLECQRHHPVLSAWHVCERWRHFSANIHQRIPLFFSISRRHFLPSLWQSGCHPSISSLLSRTQSSVTRLISQQLHVINCFLIQTIRSTACHSLATYSILLCASREKNVFWKYPFSEVFPS